MQPQPPKRVRPPARIRAIAFACALVLTLLGTWCVRRSDDPVIASPASQSSQTSGSEPRSALASSLSASTRSVVFDAGLDASPAAQDAPQQNSVARMMRATDEHDRKLLSDIERQTKKPVPAAVHELLAMRRAGKSRAELTQHIEQRMQGEALARMLAMRWLREISGDTAPAAPPVKLRTESELQGPRRLQPITPTAGRP